MKNEDPKHELHEEDDDEHEGSLHVEEDEEEGAWLVSYADFMTCLACFFILMVAFANYDPVAFQQKTEEVAKSVSKDKYKSSKTKLDFLNEEIAKHPVLNEMYKPEFDLKFPHYSLLKVFYPLQSKSFPVFS
jgi:flagellar motor protein MotB